MKYLAGTCWILAVLASINHAVAQDNWTRFRGDDATGVVDDDPRLPLTWGPEQNVKWVIDLPGNGWSSPIVCKDRVFVTSVVSEADGQKPQKGLYLGEGVRAPAAGIHHWMIYCLDLATGKKLWSYEAKSGPAPVPRHPKSSYASETPTTDGERLFVLFGDVGLYCCDFDGNLLWSQEIESKKTFWDYGAAASPVVHDDQVFVVYDNLEASWLAAFDCETGERRWQTDRDETHSWSTPFVWKNTERTEIVVPGQKKIRSYTLSGEVLWELNGKMSNLVIPSPFAAHGFCYIASGYVVDANRPTIAMKPGASGDITGNGDFSKNEFVAWHQPKSAPYNTSQIVLGDYLYTLYDLGFMTCHNAKTGEEVYGKTRFRPSGTFTASPWAYNGKIFCLNEDGLTYVVEPGSNFAISGTNMLDELCLSTPAIAQGNLLIRTASKLYCISEPSNSTASDASEDNAEVD